MNFFNILGLLKIWVTRVLFFLFLFHHLPLALTQPNRECQNLYRCGNTTVGFPFWGESQLVSCGHPSLKLSCDKNTSMTMLEIEEVVYNVLEINTTDLRLKLARRDFFSGSLCSPQLFNTTLDPNVFEYLPGYENLTIFSGCSAPVSARQDFTCSENESGFFSQSYYGPDYNTYCRTNVNVTVPEDFSLEGSSSDFSLVRRVLKEGFSVKLSNKLYTDNYWCQYCSGSGGICGYSSTNQVCYCGESLIKSASTCPSSATSPISQPPAEAPVDNDASCKECELSGGVCKISEGRFICQLRKRDSSDTSVKTKLALGCSVGLIGIIVISIALICHYKRRRAEKQMMNSWNGHRNVEDLITLKRYSYAKVKRMTNSFADIVGKGGYGTVYRGKLPEGRSVAVKLLNESKGNGEEFINEVASMSNTSHVNIVSLLGFCYEGNNRALIYEFVANGSLDKLISNRNPSDIEWEKLYEIAIGVARGLEYLHNGCKTRIVHFDIKPQNILLDENLCPKISDFGLAKLCRNRESAMSLLDARGTVGYIAPEVFSRNHGRVSHKSDAYSYGMLVLEMVGARNRTEPSGSNSGSMYFPDWIYKDLERGRNALFLGDEVTEQEERIAKKMVLVSLWCIQTHPSDRPGMAKVVEMMEGSLDELQVPPKPLMFCPNGSLHESRLPAEENSSSFNNPGPGEVIILEDST